MPHSSRLSSALPRPFAGASARLARRVPGGEASGGPGRVAADEAAAYQEALRQAFRSAIPLEPAIAGRRPTPELEANPEGVADTPEADPQADTRVTQPTFTAAPLVATTPEAMALPSSRPAAFPPAGGPPADVRARSGRRCSGSTAPADLIEVPGSVVVAADDFFGGLVRRVERRP